MTHLFSYDRPTPPRSVFRRIALLCAPFLVASSLAQSPVHHFFQSEAGFDLVQFKHALEEVASIDPTAGLYRSDDMTVIQVRSTSGLEPGAYRSACARAGIGLRPGTPDLRALGLVVDATDGPPIYSVTGDPEQDLVRYQGDVDRWNQAHPEAPYARAPLHLNER